MLDVEVLTTKRVQVTHLLASMGVRYWEDGSVNGQEDTNGDLIPHRTGDAWKIKINLETGVIADWPEGVTAEVHYKVCDDGTYRLLDASGEHVKMKDGYVPKMLAPGGDGFGDYVIMKVDGSGQIEGWKADLSYFENDDD